MKLFQERIEDIKENNSTLISSHTSQLGEMKFSLEQLEERFNSLPPPQEQLSEMRIDQICLENIESQGCLRKRDFELVEKQI